MTGLCEILAPVTGPLPEAPLHTLLNAARVVDDLDAGGVERWPGGVKVYPYPSAVAHVQDAAAVGSLAVKTPEGAPDLPVFGALLVYIGETCSTQGIYGAGLSPEEAQARFVERAQAVLGATESAAVEREFMAGDVLGLDPHLADGNGTFPWDDTPTSIVNGLALLENEIAASGRRGMIHVSPALALVASSLNLLHEDRLGVLRTIVGTAVVPGAGYAEGATPASHSDAADNEEWAYATGPVEVRRSPVFMTPDNLPAALDRATNDVTYLAERLYLVDWDTAVQAAVLIDRCSTECGSPS